MYPFELHSLSTATENRSDLPRSKASDTQVWANFRKGSEAAYQRIYDTHFDVLYNYGRQFCLSPALVKDCIQDVFVTLWVSRANLSPTDSLSTTSL